MLSSKDYMQIIQSSQHQEVYAYEEFSFDDIIYHHMNIILKNLDPFLKFYNIFNLFNLIYQL